MKIRIPRWLKRALYPLFWRYGPGRCDWCGAEVDMDAPLREWRSSAWFRHGREHADREITNIRA